MVLIQAKYMGQKHCEAIHEPSNAKLQTDAPKDNQGLGQAFSPTDLLATALGTCILTTVAIIAEKENVSIVGSEVHVEKEMSAAPRRVASLKTVLKFPKNVPDSFREKIRSIAENCPVTKSLHPDVLIPLEILYV